MLLDTLYQCEWRETIRDVLNAGRLTHCAPQSGSSTMAVAASEVSPLPFSAPPSLFIASIVSAHWPHSAPVSMFRSPLLCAFDASGRYFVSVTADNRLKLWDIATGNLLQHFQEDNHLTVNYTAIAYSLASHTTQQKKKPSASQSSPALGHVALGSKSGAISLFNLTTGDISQVSASAGQAHTTPVLSLTFHHNATQLLSTAADGTLHTYAFPSTASLTNTTCPASVQLLQPLTQCADELLAAMGSALAVLDISGAGDGEGSGVSVKKRYAPLADDIASVTVTADGKLLATASNDRHVQLWDATAVPNKKNKPIRAQHTITLDAAATGVHFNQSTTGPYHLAVVVERRAVHILSHPHTPTPASASASSSASTAGDNSATNASPTSAPLTTIRLPHTTSASASALAARRKQVSLSAALSQSQHNDRHNQQADGRKKKHNRPTALHASTLVDDVDGGEMVLGVRFVGESEVMIARGDRERVVFERVKYGGSGEEVVLEARPDESAEAQREEGLARKKRSHDVTVMPASSAPLTTTAVASEAAPTSSKKQKLASHATASLTPPTTTLATSTSFSSTLPLLQRTLAERLAELEKRAGTYAGDVRVKAATGSGGAEVVVPKAGSLQTLLTQALHTNDDALFEYCLSASMSSAAAGGGAATALSQSSTATIPTTLKQTIQRVPAAYLLPLLTRLTSLLHSRPSRALPVLTWLHCLLLTHPSSFLSLPPASLHSAFARLMGLVDARVASYKKMCRLQGKLDVIIAQLDAAGGAVSADEMEAVGGPKMLYIEGRGMVRGEEVAEGSQEGGELQSEEKGDRQQQQTGSGKKRRRRRGHAAVSPVVQPQPASMDEDDVDEERGEEGRDRTKQRGFALNGLNGARMDELDMDELNDD